MKIRFNLRLRIAAAIAAACTTTVLILGLVLYAASEKMEAALVDQLLAEEVEALMQHHQANPGFLPTASANIQYYVIRSKQEEQQLPGYAKGLPPGNHEIDIGDGKGDRDVAVREAGALRYVVIYDIGSYENREQEFRQLLLLSVAGAAFLSLALGYLLANFMTRQIRTLTARVEALRPDQAYSSLSESGQDLEVATLAHALEQYQERILTMIRREQEFTANASHELRTPITAIQTSCQLLNRDTALSPKSRERIGFIEQAAADMAEHIQALLFLARERDVTDGETVLLLQSATEAAAPMREEIERKGLVLKLDIPPDASVAASAQALRLVLGNLLRNAVQHTAQGSITVSHSTGRLTIADTGIGILSEQLPRIFDRNYRGSSHTDGLGLGLDIVKRVCEQSGWHIDVESAPRHGTLFRIRFV